jgi:uncharacterized repeat protein (TIGR04052 family)
MKTRCAGWAVLGSAVGAIALVGCNGQGHGDEKQKVVLKFAAGVGEETVRCGNSYASLGTTAVNGEILDLRYYVSNIRLINEVGEEVELGLDQDGTWQVENVALLDFEDGTGKCGDAGTGQVRGEVSGEVPPGEYTGVVFDVGVPFDLNHDDLAAAPSPLNVSAMYWAWSIGYKFVRIDLETDGGTPWSVHIGSTMCESGGPTEPPVSQCARVNIPEIRFDSFDLDHDTIVFDLGTLLASSDVTQDTPDTSTGCQSFSDDVNECAPLFPTLGLSFDTGACVGDCAGQSVFRLRNLEESESDMAAAITRGTSLYSTEWETVGAGVLSCLSCHGADGSGGSGPDIRPSSVNHLREHSQQDGPHPDGVKFDDLLASDYDDLGAFLRSICEADPSCEPESVEHGDHGDEHDE